MEYWNTKRKSEHNTTHVNKLKLAEKRCGRERLSLEESHLRRAGTSQGIGGGIPSSTPRQWNNNSPKRWPRKLELDASGISQSSAQSRGSASMVLDFSAQLFREAQTETAPPVRFTTSCCISDCPKDSQQWTVKFPSDCDLRTRWTDAIRAGTGKCFTDGSIKDAVVCNSHFVAKLPSKSLGYQEPVLFTRNGTFIQVASCRLCNSFQNVDSMLAMNDDSKLGRIMAVMVKQYFGISQTTTKSEHFLCEKCKSRLVETHLFLIAGKESIEKHSRLTQKMAAEKLMFKHRADGLSLSDESNEDFFIANERINEFHDFSKHNKGEAQESSLADSKLPQKKLVSGRLHNGNKKHVLGEQSPSSDQNSPLNGKLFIKAKGDTKKKSAGENKKKKLALKKCYICNDETLYSKDGQARHLRYAHKPNKWYYCEECNVSFKKIHTFNDHLAEHDATLKPYKCDHCMMRFLHLHEKLAHTMKHHGLDNGLHSTKFQCLTCNLTFKTPFILNLHKTVKHERRPFLCQNSSCNALFKRRNDWYRHVRSSCQIETGKIIVRRVDHGRRRSGQGEPHQHVERAGAELGNGVPKAPRDGKVPKQCSF